MIARAPLALLLTGALALAACGGGDETTTVITGAEEETSTPTTTVATGAEEETSTPTLKADTAAIESLMLGFGASVGGKACDFYSVDYLAEVGSLERCRREAADITAATFAVDDVTVDGDAGSVTVHRTDPGGKPGPITYPVVRDGESSEPYGGWKIDGNFKDGSG